MRYIFFVLLMLTSHYSMAQGKFNKNFNNDLDQYIEKGMEDWNILGLAICIIKDGKVIKEKGYGLNSINDTTRVNTNTLFMVGSVTKTFVATSLVKALYDKGYSIDNIFEDFLPDYKIPNTSSLKKLKIRQILSHQTGFRRGQDDFFKFDTDFTNKETIEKVWSLKPKNAKGIFGYHNTGYLVAGEIIEAITGSSWNEYLKKEILIPLEMDDSGTHLEEFLKTKNKAVGHILKDGNIMTTEYTNLKNQASGSLYSTVDDMKNWLLMQANYGKFKNNIIIDSILISKTRVPEVSRFKGSKNIVQASDYGLGWYINQYEKLKTIDHGGSLPGFTSLIAIIPEINVGYVILSNRDNDIFPTLLSYEIINYFSGHSMRYFSEKYKKYYESNPKKINEEKILASDLNFLKANLGLYKNNIYGTIELKNENNTITVHFEHHPKVTGSLKYKIKNEYVFKLSSEMLDNASICFKKGEKGIVNLELSLSSESDKDRQIFFFKKFLK